MSELTYSVAGSKEIDAIWKCLEAAVICFNKSNDRDTLLTHGQPPEKRWNGASERSITHRLAFYLERELISAKLCQEESGLVVDCEYNRHNGAPKALALKNSLKHIVESARKKQWADADEDGYCVFSISPDIIVHKRGTDERNRLVIEVKKESNSEAPEYDDLKLRLFTTPKESDEGFGYSLGAWVVAFDKCEPKARCLRIKARYEKGEKQFVQANPS